jgi:plasmid stabilization system protein ParE
MVCEVRWTDEAVESYISNIKYLEKDWTVREVQQFKKTVLNTVDILSRYPRLGRATNKRKNNRRIVIHKRISLYYQYNVKEHTIYLIVFWNNLQKPGKLK